MRVMTAAVLLALCALRAEAQELPKQLLLKCEGVESAVFSSGALPPSKGKFDVLLRLENGELSVAQNISLTTKNCGLNQGVIRCSDESVVDLQGIVPSVEPYTKERRELFSTLSRNTGEYNLFLKTTTLKGKEGRSTTSMNLHRSGVCKPVGSPLF